MCVRLHVGVTAQLRRCVCLQGPVSVWHLGDTQVVLKSCMALAGSGCRSLGECSKP